MMRRLIFILFLSLLQAASGRGQSSVGRAERARPVKRFAAPVSQAREIELLSFEFQRPYLGYEGPNFAPLDGEPSAHFRYLIKAELFAQEAVATAKFESVDVRGRIIRPLPLSKYNTSLDDGRYVGYMEVPSQPFRIIVSGTDTNGAPYRRLFRRLFRPTNRPPTSPLLPPDLAPAEAKKVAAWLRDLEQQALAEMERGAGQHPGGVITVPRVEISHVTCELLLSERGNPLGVRLKYDLRFSADGDYAHSPRVFPAYDGDDLRGLVEMEVLKEAIDPRPQPPSFDAPQIRTDMNTLIKYGTAARFKGGVVYHFVVEMVPDFVGQNAARTKFCVDEEHYQSKAKSQRVWEAMKASPALIKYRVIIRQINYSGETEPFYPPGIFYQGFLKDGAIKCLPHKNIYF